MVSIFLCHSSKDKPFVEKLAKNLVQLGVKVWFDKYEIKVGDSILKKVNDGLKTNDFLGVVLSPDSVESDWVWSELGAAFSKYIANKQNVILPLLLRDCEIPIILKDKKYADFRIDFDDGFENLSIALGIKKSNVVSIDNWRHYKRSLNWEEFRLKEYKRLVTTLADLADDHNWSVWVGGNNKFSLCISAEFNSSIKSISFMLNKMDNHYYASCTTVRNPNNLVKNDYTIKVGDSVNLCEEFLWDYIKEINAEFGQPTSKPSHILSRFPRPSDSSEMISEMMKIVKEKSSYYNGEKLNHYF